ncbi:Phytoene dehydrogenase-related protein [Chitinophaga rupis]|uniref:Phytoene dehydrogenase-related protein n=1 Tax=Chitinophaga rupis TaxID=573321 RepID=A0A1H8E941_9BACT|nr:NAD(P)/FAD-dependent oxidoreductase [Chitinophaga rupis]SEN15983.1 Phytoene dehydrogenase-related protein [Chitinophaga rupis]
MANKTISIIGGGMAGLCAGCYLLMNGYDVTIYEMNSTPGGVCTSWKRGDYTVDLCVQWLVGSGPASSFYERWNELIDIGNIRFVNHDEFFRVEDGKGNHISVFTNLDRLKAEFLEKAPEDEKEIRAFIRNAKKLLTFDMGTDEARETANIWSRLAAFWKMLPYLPTFGKYIKLTCLQYSEHFKNPLLKKVICNLPGPGMGIIFGMITLTWFHNKTAGYPIGGSLNFAKKICERYTELGGKIVFNARVEKVLVKDDAAIGIELESGQQYFADLVISAADGHTTIFDMLKGKYAGKKLLEFYETAKPFPSLVFVALGIKKDFTGLPHIIVLPLTEPLSLDPQTQLNDLVVHHHSYDQTLAPPGCTLLTLSLETYNYNYWNDLYIKNRELYKQQKQRIADTIIDILEKRFGNIKTNVEMTDISTPVSFQRFSGNWKGSYEGWLLTPETGLSHRSHTLEGLRNFYMCGQWTQVGGGLPGVLVSGRDTAQIICYNDGKKFVSTK